MFYVNLKFYYLMLENIFSSFIMENCYLNEFYIYNNYLLNITILN